MQLRNGIDYFISEAEIYYKRGKITLALDSARIASSFFCGKNVAVNLFIAKCYSRLGLVTLSNQVYRSLIDQKNFIPPMLLGLLYNNLGESGAEKLERNIKLIKLYV